MTANFRKGLYISLKKASAFCEARFQMADVQDKRKKGI